MIYFIDTNVFLSTSAHENINSLKQSKIFFSKIKKGDVIAVTGDIILAEFIWVLGSHYKFPKEHIVRLLRSIINTPNLTVVNNYNSRLAIDLYSKTNVKYVDCLIASIPQIATQEWTIVSYDEDFKKLPVLWKKPHALV